MAKAQHKTAMFDKSQGIKESAQERGLTDKSAKAYYKEFRKVSFQVIFEEEKIAELILPSSQADWELEMDVASYKKFK